MAQFGFGIFFLLIELKLSEKQTKNVPSLLVTISFCINNNSCFLHFPNIIIKKGRIYVRSIDKHSWAFVVRLKLLRFVFTIFSMSWRLKGVYICNFKEHLIPLVSIFIIVDRNYYLFHFPIETMLFAIQLLF